VLAIEEVNGATAYRRPINAGSMLATVKVESDVCVLTARATAFEAPAADATPCLSNGLSSTPNPCLTECNLSRANNALPTVPT
jgi:electron transfer flavoprotein alpha subunit